jgi:hypothetical protein
MVKFKRTAARTLFDEIREFNEEARSDFCINLTDRFDKSLLDVEKVVGVG